jgi:transposase InsO family protein
MLAASEGVQDDGMHVRANVVIVSERAAPEPVCMTVSAPAGMVCERFYADSGANRSVHTNLRAAASFYRQELEIGTATGGNTMRSEGVGKMALYAPNGQSMPGFDRVVFAKNTAEKLASIGDLCDAGLVCVFDRDGLKTYNAMDVKISGNVFTYDEREKRSRLYPLTLYRKVAEKDFSNVFAALSLSSEYEEKKSVGEEKYDMQWQDLPAIIEEADGSLPSVLLAKTYIKEGLSDVDRYHAKFGDVGVKYIRRALPSLKVPKQYRCEFCIDGKIHKFGHKRCVPGTRTEYLPGVCIHSDHSGPYARSIGGARYSQLYLDRGSGYLWGARMAKKTGHYEETPRIILDASALSGRRVQIFQTDGDGVFSSKQTTDMLAGEKIRHEFSAPYDSDTNAFIERARRTIFEGVSTALLRSGAPAGFWGEAEAHKIFTMNVLPTVKDPDCDGYVSRRNLLEGNKRPFNLDRLMAFGTAVTCYVPKERRKGGKEPAQRRSFKGVLLGYAETMPAYRVWDLEAMCIKCVSYNFTDLPRGLLSFSGPAKYS